MNTNSFEEGKIAYWNGEYVSLSDVRINPYDLGFLRGYAVFDVLPVIHGRAFLPEEHWKRFQKSAETLRLDIPVSFAEWKSILESLIAKNADCGSIRTVLSGGPSDDSYTPRGKETFLVLPESKTEYPESIYSEGVRVMTTDFARQMPWAKIANHAFALKHLPEKKSSGSFEILYVFGGEVYEAATSNIAMVSQGRIVTPKEGVLSGITMEFVLDLVRRSGVLVEQRPISVEEFLKADEVFLTASSKGIVPVVRVDEVCIGNGSPGKITKNMMQLYRDAIEMYGKKETLY